MESPFLEMLEKKDCHVSGQVLKFSAAQRQKEEPDFACVVSSHRRSPEMQSIPRTLLAKTAVPFKLGCYKTRANKCA